MANLSNIISKFLSLKRSKGILTFLILAFVVNLIPIYFYDLHVMRIVRFGTTLLFLISFFCSVNDRNIWVTWALLFLVFRDFAHIFFEKSLGVELYLSFGAISYILFSVERIPFIRLSGFKKSSLLFVILLTSGNILILYTLSDFVKGQMQDLFELPFFYLLGASLIVLVSSAFYYNFVLNSNRSLYFALMVFGFIFSDVCACLAYYNWNYELWYVDRFFYVVSMGCLISFAIDSKGLDREQEDMKILQDSN